jgi:hypothetical protein
MQFYVLLLDVTIGPHLNKDNLLSDLWEFAHLVATVGISDNYDRFEPRSEPAD